MKRKTSIYVTFFVDKKLKDKITYGVEMTAHVISSSIA